MQQARVRIDQALSAAVARGEARGAPPRLAAAIRHAVWPGGARIRPHLCLAVSAACGDRDAALADAAAATIELLHCASLVHDDLPCFDDAALRRGRASVHVAYGERCAVLAGDALIVMAFDTLAAGATRNPLRLPTLLAVLAQRVGMPHGIVAGQAWECEDYAALPDYHRAKTGSLFAAATELGALAAGGDPEVWRGFGERLGEAYQVADDIRDAACETEMLGKPAQQRPHAGPAERRQRVRPGRRARALRATGRSRSGNPCRKDRARRRCARCCVRRPSGCCRRRCGPQSRGMTGTTLNLRQRWFAQRDRLLTSPRFREAASRFAATRPIARQRARELFDLVAGFVYSQWLLRLRRVEAVRPPGARAAHRRATRATSRICRCCRPSACSKPRRRSD